MAPPEFALPLEIDCNCLSCGRERAMPEDWAVVRALAPAASREVVVEVTDRCPQCASTRVRVVWSLGG